MRGSRVGLTSAALVFVACGRTGQPTPDPAPSAAVVPASSPAAVASPPATAPEGPLVSALGVCNRIAASGAISRCRLADAGPMWALFQVGARGDGLIIVIPEGSRYRRFLDSHSFDGWELATSDRNHTIVQWKGGDELTAANIRLVTTQLDTP